MQTKDHVALAEYLLTLSDKAELKRNRRAFIFGCVEPDYNIATYLRGIRGNKKFRGHNAENSKSYISKCLPKMQEEGITSILDYFKLGVVMHYIADAFTYAHNSFFPGGLKEHMDYEDRLHPVFTEVLKADSNLGVREGTAEIMDYFVLSHERYSQQTASFEKDCRYIINACSKIFLDMLRCTRPMPNVEDMINAVIDLEKQAFPEFAEGGIIGG